MMMWFPFPELVEGWRGTEACLTVGRGEADADKRIAEEIIKDIQ